MQYPFVDIAVLDSIRTGLARGDAQTVLDSSLQTILWTNGAGAALLGFADVTDAAGADAELGLTAVRQISALAGFPHLRRPTRVTIRLARGVNSHMVAFDVETISLPDGASGLLLSARQTTSATQTPADLAQLALRGLVSEGEAAAMLDADGRAIAATHGFEELGLTLPTLRALVDDLATEDDRLIKRRIGGARRGYPAAVARLADDPALHLILVVDDRAESPARQVAIAAPAQASPSPDATPTQPRAASDSALAKIVEHSGNSAHETPAAQPPAEATAPVVAKASAVTAQPTAAPVRFVWRTDAQGRFSSISEEFGAAVGKAAADIIGRRFSDVAAVFGIDPDREIEGLLERRDTWSGRTVLWPIAGSPMRAPVDLAALPTYNRDREFEGFRGFGVVRAADAQPDYEKIGLSLTPNPQPGEGRTVAAEASQRAPEPPAPPALVEQDVEPDVFDDPFQGEVPALEISPSHPIYNDHKVVRLSERRSVTPERNLSATERQAFQEIGARLRVDGHEEAPHAPAAETSKTAHADSADAAARDEDRFVQAELSWVEEKAAEEVEQTSPAAQLDERRFAEEETDWVEPQDDALDDDAVDESETAELYALDGESPDGAPAQQVDETSKGEATDAEAADAAEDTQAEETELLGLVEVIDQNEDSFDDQPSADNGADETQVADDVDDYANDDVVALPRAAPDTSILDKLPVPVLLHSGDELFYANPEFLRLTGYDSLDELSAAGGLDELFVASYESEADHEANQALRIRTRSGDEFPADALLRTAPWDGRRALMLVIKQTGDTVSPPPAVEELRQRLSEMRAIVDTATDGVVLIDRLGLIRSISHPAEALFGFDSDDLRGKPVISLFAAESQAIVSSYLNDLSRNGVASVLNDGREVIGREARGGPIPLFMTMGRLPGDSGYCAVLRDITQWKKAEDELVRARADAERASTQKSEFLARVSHEIRTPLNAIIGFSELMIDEKFGPINNDRYRDYLRDISRSGNHVLDLVNDLLDLTKIEAGQQDYAEEPVALNDALAEAVAMMQPQANRERVIIRSSYAPQLPDVVADPRSIRQIALNILSNAVRYTQAGGQVVISTVQAPNGDIILRVRDTGVGMNQSELERAMKPFQQINALNRPRGDGTGLGLPLTKAMVEANLARFMISSAPGEGTLVEIVFPAGRVAAH